MKKITFTWISFAVIGVVATVVYILTPHRATVASYAGAVGEVRVIVQTNAPIFNWEVTLCWRRPGGPWMLYYLDHEGGAWRNVAISTDPESINVLHNGKRVARIEVKDGSCENDRGKSRTPMELCFADQPFKGNNRKVYPSSPDWPSEWPKALSPDIPQRNW